MIAYNKTDLENLWVQTQCRQAFQQQCLQAEEMKAIETAYPVLFYTPPFFIRAGLFLLTLIIGIFSFGLICLLFMDAIESSVTGLSIFFGLMAYVALELMVKNKNHYRSGVTEALIWTSAGAMFAGLSFAIDAGGLITCLLLLLISGFFAIRFADIIASIAAVLSLAGLLFFACTMAGVAGKSMAPFIIMLAAAILYFVIKKLQQQQSFKYYADCLMVTEVLSLLMLYAAGNYYVVREVSNSMFDLQGATIPFGWLFWIFTAVIPPFYLLMGLIKKDALLLRVGLLLIVAIVFTVKYYFSVAPIETLMTVSGAALIIISWLLTKYLKQPRHGFTYETIAAHESFVAKQIESIIIAETFTSVSTEETGTKFGGGSFGGAGAGSDF